MVTKGPYSPLREEANEGKHMRATNLDEAYADLLDGIDDRTRRRLNETLGTGTELPPRHEVRDLLDRITGRITFEEYLSRNRSGRR